MTTARNSARAACDRTRNFFPLDIFPHATMAAMARTRITPRTIRWTLIMSSTFMTSSMLIANILLFLLFHSIWAAGRAADPFSALCPNLYHKRAPLWEELRKLPFFCRTLLWQLSFLLNLGRHFCIFPRMGSKTCKTNHSRSCFTVTMPPYFSATNRILFKP